MSHARRLIQTHSTTSGARTMTYEVEGTEEEMSKRKGLDKALRILKTD